MKMILLVYILMAPLLTNAQALSQSGWPESFAPIYEYTQSKPQKNFIVLSTLSPTQVIDYRDAETMKDSVNKINFYKNFHPGHQMIGWKCNVNNVPHISFVGFNGEMSHQISRMFDAGWGLTSMLSVYTDGYLEHPSALQKKFESVSKNYDSQDPYKQFLLTTVIEVTEQECDLLINEFYDYISHPNDPLKNFSITSKPDNYEGAVCNSFALHLLSAIPRFEKFKKLATRQITLPEYLFGTGKYLPENVKIPDSILKIQTKKNLSPIKLMSYPWSKTDFNNLEIEIVDAEMILLFQKTLFQNYLAQLPNNEIKKFNLETQRSTWVLNDVNYGEIDRKEWKHVYIDKNFDTRSADVYNYAKKESENKEYKYLKN